MRAPLSEPPAVSDLQPAPPLPQRSAPMGGRRAVALALVATVGLGALLRAYLAGSGWLPTDFRHLRHAHTHLGWYGALFPLAFRAWRADGRWVPGRRLSAAYWVAVGVSIGGFLRAGYGPEAIAGSTAVLGVWLAVAWRNRGALAERSWFAAVPVLLLLAACSVGPVAAFVRRDPPLSARWVRTFLSLLLLGACLPAALARARLTAPPAWLWGLSVVGGAAYVGVAPGPVTAVALFGAGALLVRAALVSAGARTDLRLGVAAVGLGLLVVALRLTPLSTALAVAGVHLAVLGPVLHGLWGPVDRTPALAWVTQGTAVAMCAGIVAGSASGLVWAAWAGAAVATLVAGRALVQATRPQPDASSP